MTRYLYGIRNCVFHNLRPEGDITWYRSKRLRDAQLEVRRETAIAAGLSRIAALSGMEPIRRDLRSAVGKAFYDSLLRRDDIVGLESWR